MEGGFLAVSNVSCVPRASCQNLDAESDNSCRECVQAKDPGGDDEEYVIDVLYSEYTKLYESDKLRITHAPHIFDICNISNPRISIYEPQEQSQHACIHARVFRSSRMLRGTVCGRLQ